MKRTISTIFAIFFLAVMAWPAEAGWNIRQKDDGTAVWENSKGEQHVIGSVYLSLHLPDVSTAQTVAIGVPITGMRVSRIQTVTNGTITTAAATISFWKGTSSGTILGEITNQTSRMTIASESITGTVDTFSPTRGVANNELEQDQVIHIQTSGASTNQGNTGVLEINILLVPKRS